MNTAIRSADEMKDKKKPRQKWGWKKKTAAGLLCFLVLFVWYGFRPLRGPIHLGICRVYAEMKVRYPSTLQLIAYDTFQGAHRLYYTFTGPFGENRSNMIECIFGSDPATGALILQRVRINRQDEDQKVIESFNKTIPAILAADPDTVLPYVVDDPMRDIKKE